jgi:type IV pilus assembly protein PilY1
MSLPLITLGSRVADKKPPMPPAPLEPREPRIKRIARVLLPLIVTTTTLPPAAYAAPNPSLLAQQPNYISVSLEPNVALIIDDSRSMEDIRLPLPAGLASAASASSVVNTRGRATGFSASGGWTVTDFEKEFFNGSTWELPNGNASKNEVERDKEWIYRSSNLNPLYYNPRIHYKPWNDNGRAGASGNFQNAPYAEGTALAGLFVPGTTPHDMRYVGPNRRYNDGKNLNRLRDSSLAANRGANPPAVEPPSLQAQRAAQGGFAGARHHVDTTASQDLFASMFVRASGGTNVCTVPTTTLTNDPPETYTRKDVAQPSKSRLADRPWTAADTRERETYNRDKTERDKTERDLKTRSGGDTASDAAATNTQTGTAQAPVVSTRGTSARKTDGAATASVDFIKTRSIASTTKARAADYGRPAFTKAPDINRIGDRSSVLIDPINRLVEPRGNEPKKTDFTRDVRARPSRAIAVDINRITTDRTQQWRYETGVCGLGEASYAWTTTSPYAADGVTVIATCLQGGEGTKPAQVFGTRYTDCDSASQDVLSATQCITRCGASAAGTAATPFVKAGDTSKCEARCNTGGSWPSSGETRVDTFSAGVMTESRCFASGCNPSQAYDNKLSSTDAPNYDALGATQCRQKCDSTYYNVSGDTTQCIAKCATGQFDTGTGLCLLNCTTQFGTGWNPRPANTTSTASDPSSTVCMKTCDAASAKPHINPLNSWQCVNTLCSGTGESRLTVDGQDRCYSQCPTSPASTPFDDANGQATLCQRSACPADNTTTHQYYAPIGTSATQCVGTCKSPFGADSATVTGTSGSCYRDSCGLDASNQPIDLAADAGGKLTRCQPRCEPGWSFNAATAQCERSCPGALIGGVCYDNCPSGYSPVLDAGGNPTTQCQLSTGVCPTGTTLAGNVCVGGTCNPGFANVGGTCYSTTECATPGHVLHPTNATLCLSPCADTTAQPGWVNSDITKCNRCAAGFPNRKQIDFTGTPNRDTDQCWANCPSGTMADDGAGGAPPDPAKCFSCSAGTLLVTNSAAAGTLPNYSGTCQQATCGSRDRIFDASTSTWRCWGACSSTDYQFVDQSKSTQCRLSCAALGQDMDATQTYCLGACGGAYPDKISANSLFCYKDCKSGEAAVSGTPTQCRTACDKTGEYTISNTQCGKCNQGETLGLNTDRCYLNCNELTPLDGATANSWSPVTPTANPPQCISSVCPGPTTGGGAQWTISGNTCLQNCGVEGTTAAGFPNLSGGRCYENCPSDFPAEGQPALPNACTKCASGAPTVIGGVQRCLSCETNSSLTQLGTPPAWSCCPTGNLQSGGCNPDKIPTGFTCTDGSWAPDLRQPALARYYVYAPASGAVSPNEAQPQHYVLVEINRHVQHDYPRAETRTDCVAKKTNDLCSWDEEAQNFANWYTYYRTRLQAAVAVTSESLSALASPIGVQQVRLAYGSINYFPGGQDPYAAPSGVDCSLPANFSNAACKYASTLSVDGVNLSAGGALVRGVRPFQREPDTTGSVASGVPADPGSDNRTQEVFDWLFSLRTPTYANTPLREAMNSVGNYFTRKDDRSPWIQPSSTSELTEWKTSELAAEHLQCRRNYLLMITDGEWTRTSGGAQPLIESDETATVDALSKDGPELTGAGGREYQYLPAREKHLSNNVGTGKTLSDTAFYFWSRDLRTDIPNEIAVIEPSTGTQGNPAFWQHMTSFLIGYGISSYMDSAYTDGNGKTVRQLLASAAQVLPPAETSAISWPSVVLESAGQSVTSDRDAICGYDASTNPSGCGRVDDVFRAAMASRGNFLSASNVDSLTQSIRDVFKEIAVQDVSATALTGRSGNLQAGDRLFSASYTTSRWNGRLISYDALQFVAGTASGFPAWRDSNPANRIIMTATKEGNLSPGASFTWGEDGLSLAQKAALGSESVLKWLRGDHVDEERQTSPTSLRNLRNRENGEFLGTIINSQPVYSKVTDAGYAPGRVPAAAAGQGATYRTHVAANRQLRPPRIFLGSNVGMLHAFDAKGSPVTTDTNYNANHMKEVFAYVPRAAYANNMLARLTSPAYTHRYLMDGPVVEGDVYTGSSWKSVIVGTTGAGPKGVFALDVTLRPATAEAAVPTFGTSNVLWDITTSDTNQAGALDHLGHILQPGVIGSGKDGKWYYFVGNGYESTNDKARLLAINMETGAITVIGPKSGQVDDGGSSPAATTAADRPNGLGGITPVYDASRNVIAVYAGDRLGRLWKFDLSSTSSADWSGSALFVAHRGADASAPDARQPITAAPRVVPHPYGGRMVVVGTGKLFEQPDAQSDAVESVYAIWDRTPSTAPESVTAKTSLQQLTLAEETVNVTSNGVTTASTLRKLTGIADINWLGETPDLGWYYDLQVGTGPGGERVIVSPTEDFGFVNITSFLPLVDNDPCAGSGKSYFYRLDVSGNFTRPPFTGISAQTGSTLPPLSSLVGAELSIPLVSQASPLRPTNQTGTPTTGSTTLSQSTITTQLGSGASVSAAISNPCGGSVPGLAPQLNCPQAALRVWREIPRGAR